MQTQHENDDQCGVNVANRSDWFHKWVYLDFGMVLSHPTNEGTYLSMTSVDDTRRDVLALYIGELHSTIPLH